MVDSVTEKTQLAEIDRQVYADLAMEASVVFRDFFFKNILNGNYDALRSRLLDDGKPSPPLMVRKHWPDYVEDLKKTQGPLFKALDSENVTVDPSKSFDQNKVAKFVSNML